MPRQLCQISREPINIKPSRFSNFCFIQLHITGMILYEENADEVAVKIMREVDRSELTKISIESKLLSQFAARTRHGAFPLIHTAAWKPPTAAIHIRMQHQ